MKIALMTNNYKPFIGGVPISVERLANGLRELGHRVTVFAPTYKDENKEENVFRYKTFCNCFIGGIVLPNSFDPAIEKEFIKGAYDIIHVHHPVLIGETALYLSRKYHVPLVYTYHTRYEQYVKCYTRSFPGLDLLAGEYINHFMKRCDFIFAPTEGMKHHLISYCRIPEYKISVLPTGIEKENFLFDAPKAIEIKRKYDAENIPLFLTVSRMCNEKNIPFLIHSIAAFKNRYKRPFRMLMVGDGPEKGTYEELVKDLKLQEEVCFVGGIPNREIKHYYDAADVFLFSSKTETQGIVILEAFASGTPVIAVKASGIEDLVETDKNGILCGEDTDEFSQKIYQFLSDESYQNTLKEGSLQTGKKYCQESVAKEAVHRYNDIISVYQNRFERNQRWIANIGF